MHKAFQPKRGLGLLLATALGLTATDAFAQQRTGTTQRRTTTGSTGGASRSSSGEYPRSTDVGTATIASDAESRKLIITADEETQRQIQDVIRSLDRPKPQVLINVVFLQVTHGDDLDLGVEGSYTHRLGGAPAGVAGNSVASSSFGLQDAASVLAGGGLYKMVGEDFTATFRALAVKGKTEILSRPSILARNNQQATIVVGQQVPFITNTRFDAVNGQVNTVTYQDIGIILRVTPFISSDGMVEMIIQPEISSVSDKTVNISQGVNAAVIDKRSADTVVVTPDGQTIAIGGLIGTTKINQDRKIPLLGDIPLLGAVFKRQVKTDSKTELLIFLTPHVIQRAGDLARMTADEKGRLQMAPKTFSEKDLNRFLETVPIKPSPAAPPVAPPASAPLSKPSKR